MKPGLEQAVSEALQAIGTLGDGEHTPAGIGKTTGSRAHLLAMLQTEQRDFSIEELAAKSGLHANTVRAHLDVLVAAGHVERIQGKPHGRGRPPLAFKATADARAPYDELSRVLSESLGVANAPSLARRTAERWAQSLEPQPVASSADEAVDHAVESLHAVGFTAEASPLKDSITIGACPFAELVDEHPIICAIHTELLSTVLSASGQEVEVEAMDVWVRPTLCRARLTRPDQTPARTIDPKAYGEYLSPHTPRLVAASAPVASEPAASPTE
ncbi:helix-turn-helix domain-containing protein [Demequina sp. TTPB684]|uniref:helix-turn-helix transcriptional regulator n=1 Tax=unclassified Demequina TaxID=2620311 RepID=UPI001CF11996|nr:MULTISPECIES: helix-turn-helix domain-containing protein [unclassified Demequina]MCB2412450.1 helix-turn-helix domain-containing protein [Demequina sp. TTPB684]UPU88934.1 helix-turn-helix domain-containing protein [Demequina sp. TMPB413]